MPAPRTKALLLATLLLGACASNRPEYPPAAAKPTLAEAPPEDPTAPAPAGAANLDHFEDSLAAYEQQLAHNESRLRAMGVRIASADPAIGDAAKETDQDDRFAPPPPPATGDAPRSATRDRKPEAKAKAPAKAASAPTARPAPGRAQGGAAKPAEAPTAEAQAGAQARDEEAGSSRCPELCDLAHATCELEAKICDLAARHADDPRYGEVCRRADDDCRVASEACTLCSP